MSNVEMVTKCPICQKDGKPGRDFGRVLEYHCSNCKRKWFTLKIVKKKVTA